MFTIGLRSIINEKIWKNSTDNESDLWWFFFTGTVTHFLAMFEPVVYSLEDAFISLKRLIFEFEMYNTIQYNTVNVLSIKWIC